MFKRTVSPEDLARLKREREEANEAYNQAISALDSAIQQFRGLPNPPPPYDEHQFPALNERWDIISTRPAFSTGWRGRLLSFVWRIGAPLFERQQAFNSALVDHLNRNIKVQQGIRASATRVIEELGKMVHVQSKLLHYAQSLTPFIDTKDYEVSGLMRRINEDVVEVNVGLAGTVGGVADELRKRWETTLGRERRLEAQMDELRATSAVAHQVAQTLKREIGRVAAAPGSPSDASATASSSSSSEAVDSYKYVGFEDLFRGSQEDIRTRLESYLPYFEGASDVLDVGCGRGEFLELLRDNGILARGVDLNHEMVEQCRASGLTVDEADLRSYLTALPDASLGGLFAAQVVEHLEPAYLLEVLDAAYHKLRPGSTVILETINVASWSAFFQSYIRDITHVRPLHPETLRYLVTASGFQSLEVVYRSPSPAQDRLEPLTGFVPTAQNPDGLNDLVVAFNENVEKLNRLMFSDQDYAVVGKRL